MNNNIELDDETLKQLTTLAKAEVDYINQYVEPIREVSRKIHEAMQPIIDNQNQIREMIKPIIESSKQISNMIAPISNITKGLFDNYSSIMQGIQPLLTGIFEEIDFNEFDKIYKTISIDYLSNGFYPSFYYGRETTLNLLRTKNNRKKIDIISNGISDAIPKCKSKLKKCFPQHKSIINEIYNLYENRKYRLCILSIINLTSILFNNTFEHKDFIEKAEINKKLITDNIMKEKETNYLLFAPYILDDELVQNNKIIQNYKKEPEKYMDIPYCRNAIAHGYSTKFGNRLNCLRWFSVLINTLSIAEKYSEIKNW